MLLRNEGVDENGRLRFMEVAMPLGADDIYDARGLAVSDLDRDGDLDLVLNHNPGDDSRNTARAVIYRNDLADGLESISFELQGTRSNRDGIGAEVAVRVGERWMTRLRSAGSGFASQHSALIHFGVRGVATVDEVEVRWPDGTVDRSGPLDTGRAYRWIEGGQPEPLAAPEPVRLGS